MGVGWGGGRRAKGGVCIRGIRGSTTVIASFQVIIYCDLHGHSRKPNVFMYGCTADPKMASMSDFVEERLFPWMMSQKVMI